MRQVWTPLVLACGITAAGSIARADSSPPNVMWAERLVAEVAPADNLYGSHPTIVRWSEDGGGAQNRSVCSSFQTHVFKRAYGLHDADIERWFGLGNPQAKDYYAAIVAQRGFTPVAHVSDVQAGDIIAVDYGPGSRPTGHVMMIDGPAHPHRATEPVEGNLQQYEIAVIDSSHSGHGSLDTRFAAGAHTTGVGRGTLRLYAAPDGTVAGYTWSTKHVSHFYPVAERAIALGRFSGIPSSNAPAATEAGGDDTTDDQQ